jgi:beta-aspartyl-dipeptidase (metallo-type)
MLTLLKNAECFCPAYKGKNDILISTGKICGIQPEILIDTGFAEKIYDCGGLFAFPGIIDQHLHITGGGGEGGFGSGIAGIEAEKVFGVGITTVVGLLGADGFTKSVEGLYAKAKALETGGLSTYIYCGSYTLPPATITGSVIRDLIFIDKVIGVKIALSDHRSSHPDKTELTKIACEAHLGGMLSGKAGVTHIHIGDGRGGLSPLFELLESCDLPKRRFVPTHLNRSRRVFEQAKRYCKSGGNIDLTAGETTGIPVPDAVSELVNKKIDLDSVTVSSDANGSTPDGGAGNPMSLYKDIVDCIRQKIIPPEIAFSLVTANPARILGLSAEKGRLAVGADADILITDRDFEIKKVFCKGRLMVENK